MVGYNYLKKIQNMHGFEILYFNFRFFFLKQGRPTDVMNMPDGSLLISDDKGDAIYKVTYEG